MTRTKWPNIYTWVCMSKFALDDISTLSAVYMKIIFPCLKTSWPIHNKLLFLFSKNLPSRLVNIYYSSDNFLGRMITCWATKWFVYIYYIYIIFANRVLLTKRKVEPTFEDNIWGKCSGFPPLEIKRADDSTSPFRIAKSKAVIPNVFSVLSISQPLSIKIFSMLTKLSVTWI